MQKTILIVEDNAELRIFLKKALVANNFQVYEAADGAQALEAVEKYSPDLVLLDFGLPKVSGETVCVKIKKDHPEIIVIALSEKSSSQEMVHGLQIGADDYLSKPFVAEELIARIDARFKALESKQVPSQSPPNPTNQPNQVNESVVEHTPGKLAFRESVALIMIRLVLTEVIFGLVFVTVSLMIPLISSFTLTIDLLGVYFGVLIVGLLINIGILLSIALRWVSEYTEVSKEGMTKYSGILQKTQKKYACNFVEVVTLEQSLLGAIFNYGTIELYDPALKEQIYLLNISNPKKSSEAIQKIISKESKNATPFLAHES